MTPDLHIVMTGGGTGGHLFPGIAIAREFTVRNPRNRLLFVSTGNAFERSALATAGYRLATIPASGFKGLGWLKKIKALITIPYGVWRAIKILIRFKPDLVIGLGSYAALPVVLGARLMRTQTALHEQNMLPGITNRLLSRFVQRIYVSFQGTTAHFKAGAVMVTGNPVRPEIIAAADAKKSKDRSAAAPAEPFTILILGGSQGAHRINEAVIEALAVLADTDRFHFIHQTGAADEARVSAAYGSHRIDATVGAFFEDMAQQYLKADLVICRAGATTVAEVTAMGIPAIFIPFPFAADDHQVLNARMLVEEQAAVMIPQSDINGNRLADVFEYYYTHPHELATMAERAGRCGRPEAARVIVDDCYRQMGSGASSSAAALNE